MNPLDFARDARKIQMLMATCTKIDLQVKQAKLELDDGRTITIDNLKDWPLNCTFFRKDEQKYYAFYLNGGEIDWPEHPPQKTKLPIQAFQALNEPNLKL